MPSNSANPALGTLQSPLMVAGFDMREAVCECAKSVTYKQVEKIEVDDWVKCCILGRKRQTCVENKVADHPGIHAPAGAQYQSKALPENKKFCLPDFVEGTGTKPLPASSIKNIYELKNPCNKEGEPLPSIKDWDPDKLMGGTMKECYSKLHIKGGKPKPKGVKVTAIGPTKESCE